MTKDGLKGFDVPEEMKAFAEKGIAQARSVFDSFLSATQHAVNTANTQANTAQGGARQVGELALRFAERNVATSFDFAQRLVQAKDAQEVAALYSDFVRGQISTLSEQAKELSAQAAAAVPKP